MYDQKPSHALPAILAVLFVFLFFDFMQMDMMDVVGPLLHQLLHFPLHTIGFADASFFYVDVCSIILAGVLLDRFSTQRLMMASVLISMLGLLIFCYSKTGGALYLWRILAGIGMSLSYLSVLKVISVLIDHRKFGFSIGVTGLAVMPAGIVAHTPLLLLIQQFGLFPVLLLNAAFGMAVISFIALFLKMPAHPKTALRLTLPRHLFTLKNILTSAYCAFANLPLFVFGAAFGVFYLTNTFHFSAEAAATITSCIFLGDMCGGMIWGMIFDRWGQESARLLLLGGSLFLGLTLILFLFTFHAAVIPFAILFFLIGCSTSSQTVGYAYLIKNNPRNTIARVTSITSITSVGLGALTATGFASLLNTPFVESSYFLVCFGAAVLVMALVRNRFTQ